MNDGARQGAHIIVVFRLVVRRGTWLSRASRHDALDNRDELPRRQQAPGERISESGERSAEERERRDDARRLRDARASNCRGESRPCEVSGEEARKRYQIGGGRPREKRSILDANLDDVPDAGPRGVDGFGDALGPSRSARRAAGRATSAAGKRHDGHSPAHLDDPSLLDHVREHTLSRAAFARSSPARVRTHRAGPMVRAGADARNRQDDEQPQGC